MTTTYEMQAPDGKTYSVPGPDGATDAEIQREIIRQHPHLADPELKGFDPEKSTGEIYKSAGKALPGSIKSNVEETAGAMWNLVSDPKAAASALYDMGWKGVVDAIGDDLKKHYGSLDRAQKTFETDPARFILDAATVVTGGSALIRKLAIGVAKVGRGAIPEIAGRTAFPGSSRGPELLRQIGQAGEAGGQPGAVARTAIGQMPKMPQQLRDPLLEMGGVALASGHLPSWMTSGGMGAAAAGIPLSSPRLAGAAMYGLGAMERGAKALPRFRDRSSIITGAAQLLRTPEAKKDLSNDDIKTLRKAKRSDAGSATLMAAAQILQRPRVSTGPAPGSYGGTGGEQSIDATQAVAQTPDPGQSSAPPGRQEGGPVAEGQPYTVGEKGPETFVPDQPGTIVPAQQQPKQETSFLQKVWDAFITPAQAGEEDPIVKTIMQHPVLQMGVGPGMVGAQQRGGGAAPLPSNLNIPPAAQPGMATLDKFFESFPGAKSRLEVVPPAAALEFEPPKLKFNRNDEYVYHGTSPTKLEGIKKEGLQSFLGSYFASDPQIAVNYGFTTNLHHPGPGGSKGDLKPGALLRVRKQDVDPELHRSRRQQDFWRGAPEMTPDKIDVYHKGKWVPLSDWSPDESSNNR